MRYDTGVPRPRPRGLKLLDGVAVPGTETTVTLVITTGFVRAPSPDEGAKPSIFCAMGKPDVMCPNTA